MQPEEPVRIRRRQDHLHAVTVGLGSHRHVCPRQWNLSAGSLEDKVTRTHGPRKMHSSLSNGQLDGRQVSDHWWRIGRVSSDRQKCVRTNCEPERVGDANKIRSRLAWLRIAQDQGRVNGARNRVGGRTKPLIMQSG